jgi:hypothetical protein
MAFDPTTAYADDYRWHDFIEEITWEVPDGESVTHYTGLQGRLTDVHSPEVQSMAAGIGLSTDAAAFVVWQPSTVTTFTFAPRPGHVLRRVAEQYEGWSIADVQKSRFGHWVCIVDQEVTNV